MTTWQLVSTRATSRAIMAQVSRFRRSAARAPRGSPTCRCYDAQSIARLASSARRKRYRFFLVSRSSTPPPEGKDRRSRMTIKYKKERLRHGQGARTKIKEGTRESPLNLEAGPSQGLQFPSHGKRSPCGTQEASFLTTSRPPSSCCHQHTSVRVS